MLEDNIIIEVENRDGGSVGYTIPDLGNMHRHFESGEIKKVTMEELRKLSYISGGMYLIKNCFIIHNNEAVAELLGEVEPEYNYTKEDIKTLLSEGTLEQLEDCLEFAPMGVIDLVKQEAIDMKINDLAKRKAIQARTGLDISHAIDLKESVKADSSVEESAPSRRRSAPITGSTSKYKIIKK